MPKEKTKWNRGVGGIKCSCCREGSSSEAKKGFHKATRRFDKMVSKQYLKGEVE